MADKPKTANYNLTKPTEKDFYDVNDANGNMDIIDTELKKLNDGKAPSGHGLGDIGEGIKDVSFFETMKKGCGFHQVGNVTDAPEGLNAWLGLIQTVRGKTESAETGSQLAFYDFTPNNPRMWFRTLLDGVAGNWVEMLHTGNISKYASAKIKAGSYTGNQPKDFGGKIDGYNVKLNFDFIPRFIVVFNPDMTRKAFLINRNEKARSEYMSPGGSGVDTALINVVWDDENKCVTWYGNEYQEAMNAAGVSYNYIALG